MKRRLIVIWRILSSKLGGMILLFVVIPCITLFTLLNQNSSYVQDSVKNSISKESPDLMSAPLRSSFSNEVLLSNKVVELEERVRHSEMINLERKKELMILRRKLDDLSWTNSHDKNKSNIRDNRVIINPLPDSSSIQVPSLYSFLPHLLKTPHYTNDPKKYYYSQEDTEQNHQDRDSSPSLLHYPSTSLPNSHFDPLKPSFVRKGSSSSSDSKSIVFGIPTVRRPVESYLFSTLTNLIENMSPEEKIISLIVVFIAETDMQFVESQASELEDQFSKEIESGLLEIVSPPSSYYPDFNETVASLGDTVERTKWRTKQNLDFAYLMMYCQPRATYYVQLEDDVLSKPNFPSKMLSYALKQTTTKPDWFLLDFCQLGFIGKMFKSRDLSAFSLMFFIFQHDKPIDWILNEFARMKYCRQDKDAKDCRKQLSTKWLFSRPSLFQHIGTHSSLKGKVQKLRDRNFGRLSLFKSHAGENPMAKTTTSLNHYKDFSLDRAYRGRTYFWGLSPSAGDSLTFTFNPIKLESFLFRSGNSEHPEDKLPVNSSVEILLDSDARLTSTQIGIDNPDEILDARTPKDSRSSPPLTPLVKTLDGFYIVGYFKSSGVAEGTIPPEFGAIQSLRIRISSDSERWVILSEVSLVFLSN
jgi:alpha-1,3-mannosylglycoprotein beta-1,4-N-acetylglucosaminyltransferase A/B